MNALKLSPFSITYDLFVIWHTRILWRKLCTIRTDNTPFAVYYEKIRNQLGEMATNNAKIRFNTICS